MRRRRVTAGRGAAPSRRIHGGGGYVYSFNGPHSLFADTIRSLLVDQVTGLVRWRESIIAMTDDGVGEFVELGGKVLGPMVKRIAPDVKVTSVVSIEDIEALAKEIA